MSSNSELWKKASEAFKSIDIQKYLNVEERQLKIYETAEGTLFNQEVIEKFVFFLFGVFGGQFVEFSSKIF